MTQTNEMEKTMFDQVAEIVREYTNNSSQTITPQTTFADLNLDSLETVALVMDVEEKLGVTIEMDGSINTLGDLVASLDGVKC